MKLVYVDMDGVLADFDGKVREITGRWPWEFEQVPGTSRENMWAWLDHLGRAFSAGLRPLPEGMALLRVLLALRLRVAILSSDGGKPHVRAGKVRWLERHVPADVPAIFVPDGLDKAWFARPDAVLVDDRVKVCRAFAAAGGRAVLWPTRQNRDYRGKLSIGGDHENASRDRSEN